MKRKWWNGTDKEVAAHVQRTVRYLNSVYADFYGGKPKATFYIAGSLKKDEVSCECKAKKKSRPRVTKKL